MSITKKQPITISASDEDLGAMLVCAVRYGLGRTTYIVSLIVDFIIPLIPELSNKTLWCLDKDIRNTENLGSYIDKAKWTELLIQVQKEREKRELKQQGE